MQKYKGNLLSSEDFENIVGSLIRNGRSYQIIKLDSTRVYAVRTEGDYYYIENGHGVFDYHYIYKIKPEGRSAVWEEIGELFTTLAGGVEGQDYFFGYSEGDGVLVYDYNGNIYK